MNNIPDSEQKYLTYAIYEGLVDKYNPPKALSMPMKL